MHLWSNKPRMLVADRSEQMIQAVAKILGKEFEVVGFARDGEETLRAVIHLKPDVVVMDIIMPMLDGIRVVRRLREMNSPTKTVLLSGLEDQEYVEASLAAGAHGFVFKKRVVRDLSRGIHEVLAGRIFVSPRSRT
ncbi:MAG TPA: response regulator transcription factor [Acidobacteriota bacterium]